MSYQERFCDAWHGMVERLSGVAGIEGANRVDGALRTFT